jgi:DNA-binding transcriptional MerR regulator
MLRYYHEVGLLEPAEVDPESGYRRYATEQIATAQIIRRFRELDMPLEDIQAVLDAPDVAARNQLIAAHLARLESNLARVQGAVAALRNLLERPSTSAAITHQRVPATSAAAISQVIAIGDAVVWCAGRTQCHLGSSAHRTRRCAGRNVQHRAVH